MRVVPAVFFILSIFALFPNPVLSQGPGFQNIQQTKGAFLGGPYGADGGRTAVIAYHQGYLISQYETPGSRSDSDHKARFYDISDLSAVTTTIFDAKPNSSVSAHGYWLEGPYIRGFGNWTFQGNTIVKVDLPQLPLYTNWTAGMGDRFPWPGRGMLFQPFHMSQYWTYGNTDYNSGLFKKNTLLAEFNPVQETGVIGHPILLGNYLYYLSDDSGTGIAVYDITPSLENPGTAPKLIGLYNDPVDPAVSTLSVGGYWPEVWGGGGRLKVLFPARGRGIFVVDITNPQDIKLELNFPRPSAQNWWMRSDPSYAQFQDNFGFTDRFKVNMQSLDVEAVIDPAAKNLTASQFSLPVGNLLVTGGIYYSNLGPDSQGLAIWAHQAAPDKTPPTVGYHVPFSNSLNYPTEAPISLLIHETLQTETIVNGSTFFLRPVSQNNTLGNALPGRIVYSFNDILTFTPDNALADNTTYEVEIKANGIKDAAGNGIDGYRFRFSTGSTLVKDPSDDPSVPSPPVNLRIRP